MVSEKDFILRMLLSLVIGSIIGLERQFRNRHAGIRTFNILCMSSTLIGMIALYSAHYFGHSNMHGVLIAVIVSMGFLGAGVIYKEKEKGVIIIHGLTTSTTLLMTAIIGVAIGIGYIFAGVISAILTILSLVLIRVIEIKLKLKIISKDKG